MHEFFTELEGLQLKIPIFITQHMPPDFTQGLAERIARITGIPASEGANGAEVENKIYVAPGNWHMEVTNKQSHKISLQQGALRCGVRPCADNMFESLSRSYGTSVLCFVLTGMGADRAVAIKSVGGKLIVQDEESSVVWGMPGATYDKKICDWMGTPKMCGLLAKRALMML